MKEKTKVGQEDGKEVNEPVCMKDETEVGQEDGKEVNGEYGHHHKLQVVRDNVGLPSETVACVLNINVPQQRKSRRG